jgi:uroporphyrinogen decarboxylase
MIRLPGKGRKDNRGANMQMTSRERVLVAFEHEEPDRVPCWCGASVEFWDKAKRQLQLDDESLRIRLGDDFRRVFATASP